MEDGLLQCAAAGAFAFAVSSPPDCAVAKPRALFAEAVEPSDVSDDDAWVGLSPIGTALDTEQWEWLHSVLNERIPDASGLHKLLTEPGVCG